MKGMTFFMKTFFADIPPSDIIKSSRIIYTPSDWAKTSLFYVQEVGTLKSLKQHISKRKGLNSFLFLLVLSGEGIFTYKNEETILHAGDCILIDCKNAYSHQSSEKHSWELMWVHYNGPIAQQYYNYFINKYDSNIFHADIPSKFTKIIFKLMELHSQKDATMEIIASKLITDILTLCFIVSKQSSNTCTENIAEKLYQVREYIDAHFTKKIVLDELSKKFYISKFYLAREYKQMFGLTVGEYILAKRITRAKELLRFTNHPIQIIAMACGISDTSFFNKVFRRLEGMTASEYRKKW